VSNSYLFPLPPDEQVSTLLTHERRISIGYPSLLSSNLQVADRIVLVQSARQQVLPYTLKIASINRPALTAVVEVEQAYNAPIGLERASQVLAKSKQESGGNFSYITLSDTEYKAMIDLMGGKRMAEHDVLEHIKRSIAARGYYFDDETLYNYHICLKTRPLVILAGLSGTGKSKLSQLYAEALGHTTHYLRVAVRPNWNDDHYLLGYFDTITREYITEPAVDFVLGAGRDQDNLYFFCLDEMNLAHVEYYFSQFLSALEEERSEERCISLLSKRTQALLRNGSGDIPAKLAIPTNLLFTGTINVDETTQPLSDKVIDRANTIEFFEVELDKIPTPRPLPDAITILTATWQSYQALQPDTTYRSQIVEIGKLLNKMDMGLGYRVLREIEMYLANSKGLLDPQVAFDLQVKQRILPRVRGTEAIKEPLNDLLTFMKRNTLSRSEQRLDEMKRRLARDGYTSFWR
jgi:energy-coupling factor transporter ATP-binding protein EcfA2